MAKKKSTKRGVRQGTKKAAKSKTAKPVKKAAAKKRTGPKPATEKAKLIDRLRHYIRTEGAKFLRDPNITSLGIGHKVSGGKQTDDLCVQFTVRKKVGQQSFAVGLEALGTTLIPERLEVAGETIPTDVIERDYRPAYELLDPDEVGAEQLGARKVRVDPVFPGVSVAHPSSTAGTVGLIVFDRESGAPCLLSNWHVLHTSLGEIDDEVVQPGPFDDNRTDENAVGRLLRSHLGHAGDCAIATIEDREFDRTVFELSVQPKRIARPELGDHVIKSGRTTDVTRGVVRRIDVLAKIPYEGEGEVEIGGFEIGPEDGAPANHEISMGGDSGSAWLIADDDGATDIMAGLHFAGEGAGNADEHALACYAHSVFKKLNISLELTAVIEAAAAPKGYNPHFLSEAAPTPKLTASQSSDAFKLDGSPLVPYMHFSVCQSKARRLPRFVAWNIDGKRLKKISRNGIGFKLDPRINAKFQVGNELYKNNKLDRGHVARRADLCWGPLAEAKKANVDSFFYTNITPQHEAFNQSSKAGLWGELENAIFEDVDVEDLKISVMGGPIFRDDDTEFRGVPLPREFWKLIAFQDSADGEFKVRAYVLTQRDLLTDLEALELDPFRLFQVSLGDLRVETKLNFQALAAFDTHGAGAGPEAVGGVSPPREVASAAKLFA